MTEGEYANLIRPDDMQDLERWAGLNLASITRDDAAAVVSEEVDGSIGSVLAKPEGIGTGWAEVFDWLGAVSEDAAALLQRLGFDPTRNWVERRGYVILSDQRRHLADYLLHLAPSVTPLPDSPPFVLDSPVFQDWLRPDGELAPHDAVLRAIPECLSVLMLAAQQARPRFAPDAGRPWEIDRRGTCEALARAHKRIFQRKPILRDDAGERGGTGAAWARGVCRLVAARAGERAHARASGMQAHLQSIADLEDATLQDYLGEPRKSRRTGFRVIVEVEGSLDDVEGDPGEWGEGLRLRQKSPPET